MGGSQAVNVNTFTMMLIYSVDGQSDRVVSVAILNSFVCLCVLNFFHFACCCKKRTFLRYFVSVAAAVAILKVARKSILFCLLLYLEVTYSVI